MFYFVFVSSKERVQVASSRQFYSFVRSYCRNKVVQLVGVFSTSTTLICFMLHNYRKRYLLLFHQIVIHSKHQWEYSFDCPLSRILFPESGLQLGRYGRIHPIHLYSFLSSPVQPEWYYCCRGARLYTGAAYDVTEAAGRRHWRTGATFQNSVGLIASSARLRSPTLSSSGAKWSSDGWTPRSQPSTLSPLRRSGV